MYGKHYDLNIIIFFKESFILGKSWIFCLFFFVINVLILAPLISA